MVRNPRFDLPGTWHHVINRGIAKRTLFEGADDIRFFLSRLAREVRAGCLEVHAFSILTTHFHLLVRSPTGDLSVAMRAVQNEYVRRFNRRRRRDGPLVRGRFMSRPVRSLTYRHMLVRYIDQNPVAAGLVPTPALYPFGSARHYARRARPIWLERGWIEEVIRSQVGPSLDLAAGYPRVFGGHLSPAESALLQRRLAAPAEAEDPLDELLSAAPSSVRAWMERKARLADGEEIGIPVTAPEFVDAVLAREKSSDPGWHVRPERRPVPAWTQAHIALLRDMSTTTLTEAGLRVGLTPSRAAALYHRHRRWMCEEEDYAQRMAMLADSILRESFPTNICRPREKLRENPLATPQVMKNCRGTVLFTSSGKVASSRC